VAALIEADEMENVLADIDADRGDGAMALMDEAWDGSL
jgi:hypothetical protein